MMTYLATEEMPKEGLTLKMGEQDLTHFDGGETPGHHETQGDTEFQIILLGRGPHRDLGQFLDE